MRSHLWSSIAFIIGENVLVRNDKVKTTGTDIDKLMPPVSRFGGGNRGLKKQGVIDRLKAFFEKFFGIGGSFSMGTSETLEEADNSSKI